MAAAIPWEGGAGPSGRANDDACRREMRDLHDLYRGTHLTITAASAVIEDILRARLIVAKSKTDHKDTGTPVPYFFTKVVREVVQHVIEFGYFAYMVAEGGKGIRIGKPLETYPTLNDDGSLGVKLNPAYAFGPTLDDAQGEWQFAFFRDPTFIAGTNAAAGETRIIQSVLADAKDLILRHNALLENYMHRDADNSRHSGYATVNPQLGNPDGSRHTWFLGRSSASSASLAATLSGGGGVDAMIEERAELIRKLESQSALNRGSVGANPKGASAATVRGVASAAGPLQGGHGKEHAEFIVSDGFTFSEARALAAQAMHSRELDRIENAALYALGVPPQALGRNVNSERLAASNSLTQAALRVFQGTVLRYRTALNLLFANVNVDGPTRRVMFARCVPQHDLDKLMPIIKTERLAELFSCAYHVDEDLFDKTRIKRAQDGEGNDQPPASRKRKEETDGVANEQKKSRIATEAAAKEADSPG